MATNGGSEVGPPSFARNTRMWQDLGASYADLAALQDVDIVNAGSACETQGKPAGKPSHCAPHGPGGFVMADTWSIGGGDAPLNFASEQRSKFCTPPKQKRPRGIPKKHGGNFPLGFDKNDYRTVAQIDYTRDRSPSPPLPFKPKDGGGLYAMGEEVNFKTTAGSFFKNHSGEIVKMKGNRSSGLENTHQPGYNIINGAGSLSNNAFESWDGRDYRRTRG